MGFLVVLLTVLGVCVLVATGLAFERRFGRAIEAWASGTSKPSLGAVTPATRRWTEAQLFEPVSKWVEDAERAVMDADATRERIAQMGLILAEAGAPTRAACRHCQVVGGLVADGLCRACYMQSRRRPPLGFSEGGYIVRSGTGQVVRYLP